MIYLYIFLIIIVAITVYDKYIQRKHQLLINYPLIGRFRYLFEALREPLRQYFADEEFYESKDKINWVYDSANNKKGFISFAPSQPLSNPKFIINHSNTPLNNDEVCENFSVIFGENRKYPFKTNSVIARSAMSDGAISPEGTRAFAKGAYEGKFPINTGEGSLTTNFFMTYKVNENEKFLEFKYLNDNEKKLFNFMEKFLNRYIALNFIKKKVLKEDEIDTFMFDFDKKVFFRVNWDAPLDNFPKVVPDTLPDIIFQMSSGLYGVRDKQGNFDEVRYKKIMSFCKMTEIKLAQGAKQTGGKLIAKKVTPAVAYFRGVEPYKDLFSPNRFPYANNVQELFDFVARLQRLSDKPVGIKIVISSREHFLEFVEEIKRRVDEKLDGIPDFISIDGGDGGSATAPLFLMDRVGLHIKDAIYIADMLLKEYNVRDRLKLIASSKLLTPDDIVITLCLGADFIQIGRGFMLSAGCIRAKVCSGEGSHHCPVGLATQNKQRRKSYLVIKQSIRIKNYHNNLIKGIKTILAIMGVKCIEDLNNSMISFIDKNGYIYEDVNRYLGKKVK